MVFSSIPFLFRFLPAVLILYFIVPRRLRNLVLLLCSLFFYAWGEPKYVFLMLFTVTVDFFVGKGIDAAKKAGKEKRAKRALLLSVVVNISVLLFFKYADFLIETFNAVTGASVPLPGIALPIGISFFTFQTLSYTIDVYRGETSVQKNWISYATYVSMFPQLIAGPIVQYKTVAGQLKERRENTDDFAEGIRRFVTGLGKKVLIANNIGALWDTIAALAPGELTVGLSWIGALAFTFQIYFDFSAYSDMAIGLGKLFGFHFLENFDYPYLSKNITEFWRRWHISLGSWFREYVYIPLGGNRHGRLRQARNLLIVWFLTGLWHGASWNFVIWGCYYGVLLLVEKFVIGKYLDRLPVPLQRFYTMFFVIIGWVIFKCEDLTYCLSYLKAMFGGAGAGFWNGETFYYLYNYAVVFVLALFGSTKLPKRAASALLSKDRTGRIRTAARIAFCAFVLFFSVAYLVDATYNPFLYFRF